MILTAFDVKFHEKKDEIPPQAERGVQGAAASQGANCPSWHWNFFELISHRHMAYIFGVITAHI